LAKSKGLKFLETSAKANINIDKAFTMIAEDILQKVNTKFASESDVKSEVKSGSQRKKLKLLVRRGVIQLD
jgi:GTPase SAR1 family protein